MANQKQIQIQNAFQKQIEIIDQNYLRGIRKEMYECAARCCDNTTSSMDEVNVCVNQCSSKLEESQNYVSSQFTNYQGRLQRCVSQCNDEAKDQLGASPSDSEVQAVSKLFENCACNCIDKNMELLPQFMKKIHEVLSKKVPSKVISQEL